MGLMDILSGQSVTYLKHWWNQDGGPPPFIYSLIAASIIRDGTTFIPGIPANAVIPVSDSDNPMPVPVGYPAYLPRPYLDKYGRLVLRPVPVSVELSQLDVGWIMTALQPLIDQYSVDPYPINYELGSGSGYGVIKNICEKPVAINQISALFKFHNFLINPSDPESEAAKQLVGMFGNMLFPGLGTIALTLVRPYTQGTPSPGAVFPGGGEGGTATESDNSGGSGSGSTTVLGVSKKAVVITALVAAALILFSDAD